MLMDKIKSLFNKEQQGNDKKKIENLVIFVIILIITLIAINMILNGDKKQKQNTSTDLNKKLATIQEDSGDINSNNIKQDNLSQQLEEILEKIEGVGKVKVLITYSKTNETIPMYNEDNSQKDTEEKDTGGGTRKIIETDVKRQIIYQENNGQKTPIIQSITSPKIEGAVIAAQGAGNATVKTNIIQAAQAVTGIASHKIQVFTMGE